MMIYFADRGMNVIGQAGSKLPQGMVIVDDLKVEEVDTGVASFECTIPFSPPMRGWAERCAQCGNYILRDNDGGSELYTIIESQLDTKKGELTVYAEDAGLDLLNEIAMAFEAMEAYPIAWYIEKFSYDTGFEIGINEAADLSRKLKWDGESTLAERLTSVATQFGCELSYSFTTDGMKLTHKYINIYRERGEDNGVSLRLNKEIDRIVTSRTIENLATALYPTGGVPEGKEENITLRGYSYDDGDICLENGYLKSREAVKKWSRYLNPSEPYQDYTGHILRTYTYDTVDQQTLCSHAITALKKARDVDVNYEIDITDLPEHVRIGDRVNIVDDAGELYVSSRILKLETSITNNTKKATLGEYLIKTSGISDKVSALASDFAAAIKRVQKVASSAVTDVANAKAAADAAQETANTAKQSAEAAATAASNAQSAVDAVDENVSVLETTVSNAQAAADQAKQAAENAEKVATNFLSYDATDGLLIGNKSSGSWNGYRTQIKSDSFNILDSSGNVLASYGANDVYLGANSQDTVIHMCNDLGTISYDSSFGSINMQASNLSLISGSWESEYGGYSHSYIEIYGDSIRMFSEDPQDEYYTDRSGIMIDKENISINGQYTVTITSPSVSVQGNLDVDGSLFLNGQNFVENGTWTPVLINESGSAPTYTTGWSYAYYIKIGKLVFISVDMAVGISSKGGSYAKISGLPYTCGSVMCALNSNETYQIIDMTSGDLKATFRVVANTKNIRILTPNGSNSYSWKVNTSAGTNAGRLRFSGVYGTDI